MTVQKIYLLSKRLFAEICYYDLVNKWKHCAPGRKVLSMLAISKKIKFINEQLLLSAATSFDEIFHMS